MKIRVWRQRDGEHVRMSQPFIVILYRSYPSSYWIDLDSSPVFYNVNTCDSLSAKLYFRVTVAVNLTFKNSLYLLCDFAVAIVFVVS